MSLSNADKAHIRNANAGAVEVALGSLPSLGALSITNAFGGYRIAHPPPYTADETDSICELMAVGMPNHCIDGWSFLARSIAALLAGDNHAARHFAYYAELRAGMSLLSAGGIGIFNRSNIVAIHGGTLETLQPEGTHVAVWEALDAWLQTGAAAQLMAGSMSIAGTSLTDCLDLLLPRAGGGAAYSLNSLVHDWGLDLMQARTDKHTREISSYDPHVLFPIANSADEAFNFTATLWQGFEPFGLDRFDNIDRHILRTALQHYFNNGHTINREDYNGLPEALKSVATFEFLTAAGGVDEHILIAFARDNASPASPFSMISRATLLLRTATSVTRASLRKAGLLDTQTTRPWLNQYATDRAIASDELPDIASELWQDIEEAIDRVRSLQEDAAQHAQIFTRWTAANDASYALPRLSELERVALWSLAV